VRKFFDELRELAEPEGGFLAIVEICGFNDWLLEMLQAYGCRETVLIQPEKRSRKKTDRRDASALSQLLWVNRQRVLGGKRVQGLKRIILPSQEEQDNRQLTALRKRTAGLPRKFSTDSVQTLDPDKAHNKISSITRSGGSEISRQTTERTCKERQVAEGPRLSPAGLLADVPPVLGPVDLLGCRRGTPVANNLPEGCRPVIFGSASH